MLFCELLLSLGLFWLQFLISFFFGWPWFSWVYPGWFGLHLPLEGLGFSAAQFFFGLSIVAGLVSLTNAFIATQDSSAKWRQRCIVFLFCVFPIGWSTLPFRFRDAYLEQARLEIRHFEEAETPQRWTSEKRIDSLREVLRAFD